MGIAGYKTDKNMAKFTFKTEKPTGKWRSFGQTHHYIKLDGKQVGTIKDDAPHKIRFMVYKSKEDWDSPKNNPNCDWEWVTLAKDNQSVLEAKEFLNNNIEAILAKFNLRKSAD